MQKESFMVKSSNGRLYVANYDESTHSVVLGNRDTISNSEPPPKQFEYEIEALQLANFLNKTCSDKYVVTHFHG